MLAIVCPGQGAQTPGMLTSWLELPGSSELLARWSNDAGVDLIAHGTTSDADTIRDTAIAQPLIVATSLLTAHHLGWRPTPGAILAGHSVGEFAAAALAGVFSSADAVRLVAARGSAMAAAAAVTPTGMSAVVGGESDEVRAAIEDAHLTAANVNSAAQVVAAGTVEQLAQLAANPPARARVIPLQVAGAFHTHHMSPAVSELRTAAEQIATADPAAPLLSNADGAIVTTAADTVARLIAQVANPVRWDLCQETLVKAGVSGMLELAPGGVLAGLAKRAAPGVATLAVKSANDLPAAAEFIAAHGGKDHS